MALAGLTAIACDLSPTGPSSPTVVAVGGGLSFTTISAAGNETCGIATEGGAYCWGVGMLGDSAADSSLVPIAVSGGITFTAITAGSGGSTIVVACGLAETGAAYCWGNWLGNGTTASSLVPVAVAGGLIFTDITAGGGQVCGLTGAGMAYCWGGKSTAPVAVSGGLTFANISVGGATTCGVTTSGAAYCWGNNYRGSIGNDSIFGDDSVPVAVVGGLTFQSVSVGLDHTCGITANGAAYCWGENDMGELGDGSSEFASGVPVRVSGGLTFTSLSAGFAHTCGVTGTGAAYCWGWNVFGQLGNSTTGGMSRVPVEVMGGLRLGSLSAGYGHTCGLTIEGAAYCWGATYCGERPGYFFYCPPFPQFARGSGPVPPSRLSEEDASHGAPGAFLMTSK